MYWMEDSFLFGFLNVKTWQTARLKMLDCVSEYLDIYRLKFVPWLCYVFK